MNFWIMVVLIVVGIWVVLEIIGRFFPDSFKQVIADFFRFLLKGN